MFLTILGVFLFIVFILPICAKALSLILDLYAEYSFDKQLTRSKKPYLTNLDK